MWAATKFRDLPLSPEARKERNKNAFIGLAVFTLIIALFVVLVFGPFFIPLPLPHLDSLLW